MATDYRAAARQAAKRYGLDPDIFVRQIQQESGFNPTIRSPAGATGIAQIMPATARGWGVNPLDPLASLNAAAKNMAGYVRKYGGYENALRAYNAGPGAIQASKRYKETNNYVKTILGGRTPKGTPKASGGGSEASTTMVAAAPSVVSFAQPERPKVQVTGPTTPGFAAGPISTGPRVPEQEAAPQKRFDVGAALEAITKLQQPVSVTTTSGAGGPSSPSGTPDRGSLAPGGNYGGTTKPVEALARLAHGFGLVTTSGKRDTVMTASGNVSDHYAGNKNSNARDLSGSVAAMDNAAVALAKRLGIKGYKKGQTLEKSFNRGGLRYQILYRTNTGGNHFNHIHVGVKRG